MGCGKSTIGKVLAKDLDYTFVDMDEEIEEKESRSINDIFKENGERAFRGIETQFLTEISQREDVVCACGGGAPCFNDNISVMKKAGFVVYLALDEVELYNRLLAEKEKRPLIRNLNDDQLKRHITNNLLQRKLCYSKATEKVDTNGKNVQQITEDILRLFP